MPLRALAFSCTVYLDELLRTLQNLKLSPLHCVPCVLCRVVSYIILFTTLHYNYLLRTRILHVVLEHTMLH